MADAPDLDPRSFDDVIAQTEALATVYTSSSPTGPWLPRRDGTLDFGGVMIRLFGTMVDHLIVQLNQVPHKHQIAFTRLLGAVRTPARAARAAITFVLDDGTRTATVPLRAQVAGTSTEGTSVVFETELPLALTRARLQAVFVRDVQNKRYADRTSRALGIEPQPYEAFRAALPRNAADDLANHPIEHEVYVALDQLAVTGATKVTLTATATAALPAQVITWSGYLHDAWSDLPPVTATTTTWELVASATAIEAVHVAGSRARWLRGTLPAASPPLRLTATVAVAVANVSLADATRVSAFTNGQPADFTRDVLAFGERPRPGDVFYFASDEAFSLADVTVTLAVLLTNLNVNASADLKLQWEAWDGRSATLLGETTKAGIVTATFTDTTKAFTANGSVTFKLVAPVPQSTIGGVTARWVRVRIVAGNYGSDTSASVDANNKVTITPASFRPPAIASATLGWTATLLATPAALLRRTAQTYEDLTAEALTAAQLYRAAPESVHQSTIDTLPSLYLGFDWVFEPTITTLYFQVMAAPAPSPSDFETPPPPRIAPRLAWEYWNGESWTAMSVEDGTHGMTRSGLVRFLPPADARPLQQFGKTLHWVRARAESAELSPMPLLGRVSTNTVWASHAHTNILEVLGASNGARDQVFKLSQSPVLYGQVVEVGEPDWASWQAVPDFWASGPRDRHYTIDSATGTITFGNGTRGMIPPKGQRNVRAAAYSVGGGAAGNVAAGTLVQLKTTVPIVSAATNYEAASGGAAVEPITAMMERASRTLRHGGRAVTAADYADLALEASTAVARAVALTPSFVPIDQGNGPDTSPEALHRDGQIIVVIVPTTLSPGAAPTTDVLSEVEDYLRARCPPGARVEVTGPSWIAADITVHVVAQSLGESDSVLDRTRGAIARLLDPISGGDGSGWHFGRRPRRSDLVACIDAISGIDHLSYIAISCEAPFDAEDVGQEISVDELSLYNRLLVYARSITVTHAQRVTP